MSTKESTELAPINKQTSRTKLGHQWDLPVAIVVNGRSLRLEKLDELQVTVNDHDASIVCISETWFREYIGDDSVSINGFSLERKDRCLRRGGGVACYVKNSIRYTRLSILEDEDLEVLWLKIMPKRSPRKISCVLLACIYSTQDTDFLRMRDHRITGIHKTLRKHPDCGILITGDFNQLNDTFLRTDYRLVQVVTTSTRGVAILDKVWTNMADVYCTAVTISELGSSDHNMVLLRPIDNTSSTDKRHVIRVTKRSMGQREKEEFANALSLIRWEPLYRLTSCEDMYIYYHTIIITLMNMCFPAKVVTRHPADKPWVTDEFRSLVRSRQRAHMRGDTIQEHFCGIGSFAQLLGLNMFSTNQR